MRVEHPTTPTSPRNYSLSDRPGKDHFRISVKREPPLAHEAPGGLISNHLHDAVEVGDRLEIGPPCGEFTLDPAATNGRPIVLLAGGIGVTPLLAMAKSLQHAQATTPVYFLQAAKNSHAHALGREVRELSSGEANFRTHIIYDEPLADDLESGRCDSVGFVTTELLRNWAPLAEADCYLCGPPPFMASVLASLRELGVAESSVRHEFFGPMQALEVA
jgi:nitric oxide dioxygenase